MPASPPPTRPRSARVAAAAVAVALLIAVGAIGKRLLLDRAAPHEVHEPGVRAVRDAESAATSELPLPVAARKQDDSASGEPTKTNEPAARPTGEVRGTVRRPRDGSAVTEGVVAFSFVVLADHEVDGRPLDAARFAALDEDERLALHTYDEAPIGADGTFRCRLAAPAIVRHAAIRPKLGANQGPQFLETERELGDLELAADATLELPLVVDDGGSIEGVVVTAEGGFPIAGARVSITWWSDSNDDWSCTTDRDGRFRVSGIRREVAAARSNSEAVVTAPGCFARRFLVPPADDDLDVKGLRLAMTRGIVVVVDLLPPDDLAPQSREEWDRAIAATSATLRPLVSGSSVDIAALPWIARVRESHRTDEGRRLVFEPAPPTRDAIVVVHARYGGKVATVAADVSTDRAPLRLVVPLPLDDSEPVVLDTGITLLTLHFFGPEGRSMRETPLTARALDDHADFVMSRRTDDEGLVRVPRPFVGMVQLRVAGYESEWLAVNPAAPADAPLPDPLEITLRPLTPAR